MTDPTTPGLETCLWFDGTGHAAATYYCSLFDDAQITDVAHQMNPDGTQGAPFVTRFTLQGQRYIALDGGPQYTLSPAISLSVSISTQAQLDRLWSALLADGGRESRCGWLTDRFGLSWQIVPRQLPALLASHDRAAAARVMTAMMGMVKPDIAGLEAAAQA